jgi:hypothetical protein
LVLPSLLASAAHAFSAQLDSSVTKEGKVVIALHGDISEGDAASFSNIVKAANAQGKIVSGIRLNSQGGNLSEGLKLADLVRFAKIATIVPNGSLCASACFLIFAGGEQRFASRSSQIGVHGASFNGAETPESSAATIEMVRYAKLLGVPDRILGEMAATPPSEMFWLSQNDLLAMNVTLTGRPQQTPPQISVPQTQLPPSSSDASIAPNGGKMDWAAVVKRATDLSSQQNNGSPRISRVCQPELKTCSTAIGFAGDHGEPMIVRLEEDISGNAIKRDVCMFNQFIDVRTCVNWDTGATIKEMKDVNGIWQAVQ